MKYLTIAFFFSIFSFHPSFGSELSRGLENNPDYGYANPRQRVSNQCSAEEQRVFKIEAEKTLSECNANWQSWGIDPKPPKAELLNPGQCTKNSVGSYLSGCGQAISAFPIMVAKMGVYALAAGGPIEKDSYAYVSQFGTEQDIKNYVINKFTRSICRFAKYDESFHIDRKCSAVNLGFNPFENPEALKKCKQNGLNELRAAHQCRRATLRAAYRKNKQKLTQEINQIYREQQERKKLEEEYKEKLNKIDDICGHYINPYRESISKRLFNPGAYLAGELQALTFPNERRISDYNKCVSQNTKSDFKLRAELQKSSASMLDKIFGNFEAMKCYRPDIRKKLKCEIALGFTGVGGALVYASKKLGKKAFDGVFRKSSTGLAGKPSPDNLYGGGAIASSAQPLGKSAGLIRLIRTGFQKAEVTDIQVGKFPELTESEVKDLAKKAGMSGGAKVEKQIKTYRSSWNEAIEEAMASGWNPDTSPTTRYVVKNKPFIQDNGVIQQAALSNDVFQQPKGTFGFAMHGGKGAPHDFDFELKSGEKLSAGSVSEMMKRLGHKEGQPIQLTSCNSGCYLSNIENAVPPAQKIACLRKSPVIAINRSIFPGTGYPIGISEGSFLGPDGEWMTFSPSADVCKQFK